MWVVKARSTWGHGWQPGAPCSSVIYPQPIALPLVLLFGFVGGGLWALIPAILRAKGWLNEVISTLLLNYVAVLFVNYFIFGPWRDPDSANFPQTAKFADAVRLPLLGDSRLHAGSVHCHYHHCPDRDGAPLHALGL